MSLYAQIGYGKGQKVEKGIIDKSISGIILSPKDETPQRMKDFIMNISKDSPNVEILFDPQFYVGAFTGEVSEGKLEQYPYYTPGLTRSNLSIPKNIKLYASNTIEFQRELNLKKLVSPTIFFDDFSSKESQIAVSIAYESIDLTDSPKELIVNLCINENAFRSYEKMNEFLDIISLLDVRGFYIIVDRSNPTPKNSHIESTILTNLMTFCYSLSKLNEYEVILGYTDMLGVPLMTTGITAIASGWHNRLKMFTASSYQVSTGGRRPRKRYTSESLMNSILINPELSAIYSTGKITDVLSNTKYDSLLIPNYNDTGWSDEASCLHNWFVLNKLITDVKNESNLTMRLDLVIEKILKANHLYRTLGSRIPFDNKSNNSHLNIWLTALNEYRNRYGI